MKDVAVTKQEITVNTDKQDVVMLSKTMENLLGLKFFISRSVPKQLKEILDYLHSIQYEIGDINYKVKELSDTQKDHIEKTEKELLANQTRIRSINNKVVEIIQIVEPIKQENESRG